MKTSGVLQVSIVTTTEGEEPIAALLERIFKVTPSIYTSAETGGSTVTAFVRARPGEVRARQGEITAALSELRELGLQIGPGDIRITRVRREDWAESWKKYFKVITVGSSLIIKPSWSKLKARAGQAVVVLDPGLSFGTGQHPTTGFCLKQIARVAKRRRTTSPGPTKKKFGGRSARGSRCPRSLLDIGCGSGILAIAAAKLGFAPVEAFDFDPVSVRVARNNSRINRLEKKVTPSRKDLTNIPLAPRRKYDVVCANLMAPLLLAERDRIVNRLAPGGTLILAGILGTEFDEVRARYEAAGLKLIATRKEREWQSGAFETA